MTRAVSGPPPTQVSWVLGSIVIGVGQVITSTGCVVIS